MSFLRRNDDEEDDNEEQESNSSRSPRRPFSSSQVGDRSPRSGGGDSPGRGSSGDSGDSPFGRRSSIFDRSSEDDEDDEPRARPAGRFGSGSSGNRGAAGDRASGSGSNRSAFRRGGGDDDDDSRSSGASRFGSGSSGNRGAAGDRASGGSAFRRGGDDDRGSSGAGRGAPGDRTSGGGASGGGRFGSGSSGSSAGRGASGDRASGSGSSRSTFRRGGDDDRGSSGANRFGSGSSGSSAGRGAAGDRTSDSSSGSSRNLFRRGGGGDDKKSSSRSGSRRGGSQDKSSSSGGRLGGLRRGGGDDKASARPGSRRGGSQDKASSGSGRLGGLRRGGGDDKASARPGSRRGGSQDKASSSGGRLGGLRGGGGDDKKSSSRSGSRRGGSQDKASSSGGRLGGLRRGGGDDKSSARPGSRRGGSQDSASSGGGRLGGLRRGGDDKGDRAQSAPRSAGAARTGTLGRTSPGASGGTPRSGSSRTGSGGSARASSRGAAKSSRGSARGGSKPLPSSRSRVNVKNTGLTLDQKLDILGLGMIAAAIVLISGAATPGGVTAALDSTLAQLFGVGRIFLAAFLAIGGIWLLIARFGSAIDIEYFRIVGLGLLFVVLVTTLQWQDLFFNGLPSPDYQSFPSYDALEAASQVKWENGDAGGLVGHFVYILLARQLGDIGVVAIMILIWIVALALTTQTTTGDIADQIRNVRHSLQVRREAKTGRKEAKRAEKEAPAAPAVVAAATATAALASATATEEKQEAQPVQRTLPSGRRSVTETGLGSTTTDGQEADPEKRAPRSGGLLGRRSSTPEEDKAVAGESEARRAPSSESTEKSDEDAEKKGGRFGRRLVGGRVKAEAVSEESKGRRKSDEDGQAGKRRLPRFGRQSSDEASEAEEGKQPERAPASEGDEQATSGRFGRLAGRRKPAGGDAASEAQETKGRRLSLRRGASSEDDQSAESADSTAGSSTGRRGRLFNRGASSDDDSEKVSGYGRLGDDQSGRTADSSDTADDQESDEKATRGGRLSSISGRRMPFGRSKDDAETPEDESKPAEEEKSAEETPATARFGNFGARRGADSAPEADDTTSETDDSDTDSEADDPLDRIAAASRPAASSMSLGEVVADDLGEFAIDEDDAEAAPAAPATSRFAQLRSSEADAKPADDDGAEEGQRPARQPFGRRPDAASDGETRSASRFGQLRAPQEETDDTQDETESAAQPFARRFGKTEASDDEDERPARAASRVGQLRSQPAEEPSEETTESEDGDTPSEAVATQHNPLDDLRFDLDDDDADESEDTDEAEAPAVAEVSSEAATESVAEESPEETVVTPEPALTTTDAMDSDDDEQAETVADDATPEVAFDPAAAASEDVEELVSEAVASRERLKEVIRNRGRLEDAEATPTPEPEPEPAAQSVPAAAASNGEGQPEPAPQPVVPVPKYQWVQPAYMELLEPGSEQDIDQHFLLEQARLIEDTLGSFGAPGKVVEVNSGPVITQFGVEPDYLEKRGGRTRVKVSAIASLDKDIALALAARTIRIEAPVPGKGFVGIEVPNAEAALVSLRDVMSSEEHQDMTEKSPLTIGLGQSVDGSPVSADLTTMPHLLIAGTTGSGKSVCVNAIISCLLLQNSPDDLQMIMVDPKRVELTGYNGIPHLISNVVVDLERIIGVLKWVQREMDQRYKQLNERVARNIQEFNRKRPEGEPKMPYLVVVIDELADLMMLAPDETEKLIARLAQMARATGIHLIISTQRPSVDVVTGLIKANFPARIAFAVASGVDSRVILDGPGADRLLGRGDMLWQSPDASAPVRMQGVFVSDPEIDRITRYWKEQAVVAKKGGVSGSTTSLPKPHESGAQAPSVTPRSERFEPELANVHSPRPPQAPSGNQQSFWKEVDDLATESASDGGNGSGGASAEEDDLYDEAVKVVKTLNKASVSLLQRRLRIGYTRAARLIDLMEEQGIIGPAESGSKPRRVIQ